MEAVDQEKAADSVDMDKVKEAMTTPQQSAPTALMLMATGVVSGAWYSAG